MVMAGDVDGVIVLGNDCSRAQRIFNIECILLIIECGVHYLKEAGKIESSWGPSVERVH